MHLVSHSLPSLFLLLFPLYIYQRSSPTGVCDVDAAVSGALDERCYTEGVLLLQWQNRSSGLLVSSLGAGSSTILLAEHVLSPESLQRHRVKWIFCVAPGVEVNL